MVSDSSITSNTASVYALYVEDACTVNISASVTLTVSGIAYSIGIAEDVVLSLEGSGTVSTSGYLDGPGTLEMNGASLEGTSAYVTNLIVDYQSGSFSLISKAKKASTFGTITMAATSNSSYGLLEGIYSEVYDGEQVVSFKSNNAIQKSITMAKNDRTFAVILPVGTDYAISSALNGADATVKGTDSASVTTSTYTVSAGTVTTYTDLKRSMDPTFWQAHSSNVQVDSSGKTYQATLTAEVDKIAADTYSKGSETVTERGFYIQAQYEIVSYSADGSLDIEISDNGEVTSKSGTSTSIKVIDTFTSYMVKDETLEADDPDNGKGEYSVTVDGLEVGYVYVVTPYVIAGGETYYGNAKDTFNSDNTTTVYKGLSTSDTLSWYCDPLTETTNASFRLL